MITAHKSASDGLYPLSSSQARIWFMEKLDKEITAYNIPLDFKITGALDMDLLQKSIDILVGRHAALRTIFPNGNGSPSQKILPSISSPVRIVHLEDQPAANRETIISRYSLDNAQRKFDLMKGPLFQFELLVLGGNEYIFLINFHHLISDATSVTIFLKELRTVYTQLAEKRRVELPDLFVRYTDYALWEKEWLQSRDYREQLAYWKNELDGAPDILQLPADFRRPKMQSYRGTEYHFEIAAPQRDKIAAMSKTHGTSLFVPLMAAYSVLLSRYASQNDMVIGVPVANRKEEELESMIGVLINTLPLRVTLQDHITFSGVIDLVKEKFRSAYSNQEVAFERLVEELKVKRNTAVSPVFQVLFNFLTGYGKEFHMPGLSFQMIRGERRSSQVDLTLTVIDQKEYLKCILEYNTDLFRKETVERFAGHYLTLLEAVTGNVQLTLQSIPLLTEKERSLHLDKWNETKVPYPADRCTHHLFEDQAARTPDSVALCDDTVQLAYSDLNARANRFAHYLVNKGAREDTFVAVYLDRSADLIIGLLAIAKTGATYLPLDPIFPKARIGLILEDAMPVLTVTQRSLLNDLPESTGDVILIDDRALYENEPQENLPFGNPQKPAYILYTSGSTGKPKGVMVKHNSTVNIVRAVGRLMSVTPDDTLLSATTFTFDVAEMEMYLPLFNGGRIVIASQEIAVNPDLLKKKMAESHATLFLATPVTFKMLVMSGWEGSPHLRVLCGGEALPRELAAEMLKRCKEVFNGYAPTETTIYSLIKKVDAESVEGDGYVSLGRPLDNTILYVLNPDRVPVPVGMPGELYIGGEGVSAGYLNLPGMNAERFINDPLGRDPGMTFYKTGDLVHYTRSGDVNFMNRLDFQVKIRGFRIELGEIESALAQFDGVKENVVVVRSDPSGEKKLVAYMVMKEGFHVDHHELHTWLKGKLPDYMVPAAFVGMERFPLTSTLKVDRNALPEPESLDSPVTGNYAGPSSPTEKKMGMIWSSLLGVKRIGIHDDFFEIGGHSMIAVALMVKIEKELGIRIPLSTLFERSTIALLSELVDKGVPEVQWRSLVPIRPAGKKKPLFLVHGMGLNVLLYTTVVNFLDPDQPVYGLQAKGLNGTEKPLETIEEIAAYYISEIMSVDKEGPYAMAGFSLGGRIAYEMARQLTATGRQISFLGIFDATADETFSNLPFAERNKRRLAHFFNYVSWNVSAFFREKDESRWTLIRRRWNGLGKKINGLDFKIAREDAVSFGKRNELPKYLRRVHRANSKADRNYVIRPYPGTVHLFKAKKQTFYIPEPVNYGWNHVAMGGVVIHEVPGEHSNTFAPPNDKFFADLLQKSLNESVKN